MRKLMLLTGSCAALAAWADVVSWTGSQGGYWINTASWAGGALPGASDTADFSALGDDFSSSIQHRFFL